MAFHWYRAFSKLHINDAPRDRFPYERTDAEGQEPMATCANVAVSLLLERKARRRDAAPSSAQPTIERIRPTLRVNGAHHSGQEAAEFWEER